MPSDTAPDSVLDLWFHDWGQRTWYGKFRLAIGAPFAYSGLLTFVAIAHAARAIGRAKTIWPSIYKPGHEPDDEDGRVTGFEPYDDSKLDVSFENTEDETDGQS